MALLCSPFSRVKVSVFFLFLLLCHLPGFLGGSSDELALLSFKSLITDDPYGGLASWGNHSLHFCQWQGVTCRQQRNQLKVTALDLHDLDLAGSVSPSLGNLTFLQRLHLSENLISGAIPDELGQLSNLQHLNLSFNLLGGMIPQALSQCFHLQTISLTNNAFHGEIPSNLSHLLDLQIINLGNNFFSGIIPASLGALNHLKQLYLFNNLLEANESSDWAFLAALANCSNLQVLDISTNGLRGVFPVSISNLSSDLQILSLETNEITGRIPPSICRLINLQMIYLGENLLEGTLPQEIGFLHKLELFSLTENQISGPVPSSFGNLSSLRISSLHRNQFSGDIPKVLQNLTSLTILSLSQNYFVGIVPPFLGSLLNLRELYLHENNLYGSISPSLGGLHFLNSLSLGSNNLEGRIPYSIWNLSSLQYLQLIQNNLSGVIPSNIGQTLPNLAYLLLHQNQFHGPIPTSLSNCSSLEQIDLSVNAFTGKVRINFGALKSLSAMTLQSNMLEARDSIDWTFIESLANCTNLEILDLSNNEFRSNLPSSIANLSTSLRSFAISGNIMGGTIPVEIKNLVGLSWLELGELHLTGIIPLTIGSLRSLQVFDLNTNELCGEIPYTIGNLTQLNKLYFDYNNLSGHIPPSIGLCNKLEILNLENNMLIGTIPNEITYLSSLTMRISLSNNLLVGPLPSNFGSLINMGELDVSNNNLSGEIPSSLGQCQGLQYLHMENNFFGGSIPLSLEALKGVEVIDFSNNKLVGEIPTYLVNFSLKYLNLSFNNLEGEVPKSGIFANLSAFSVFGNKQLCGGIPELNLPACFNQPKRKGRSHLVVIVITVAGIVVFFIIFIVTLIASRNKLRKVSPSSWRLGKELHVKISYAELHKTTNGFSPENLIGVGSFGSVYKGNMDSKDHNIVAVKVLNLQQHGASKSFEAECKALRSARHRNIVKVLTACSSIDYAGNNFKALVFEFMANGTLDKWLHPQLSDGSSNRTYLILIQRLNIALDVACALDYLHNQGSTQIIHCDLKPSNVLLDEDMVAHVGDFGLAILLTEATPESSQTSITSIALKGTIGYVAPEYGIANQVSTRGDVYSFGILLLEIFTGRRPTDAIFIDSHNLHQFVEMALPEHALTILDPKMFSLQEDEDVGAEIQRINSIRKHELECIVSVLHIGLLCSKESPLERIQIRHALKRLHAIKDAFNEVEHVRHS